jgi:hypothetical protein
MRIGARFLLALLLISCAARADEIRLKDGSKIIGTIVGFEDGAFKVQTSYGFAMVRKDQIAEIIPTPPPKPAPAKPKESSAAASSASANSAMPNKVTSPTSPATTSNSATESSPAPESSAAEEPSAAQSPSIAPPDSLPNAAPVTAPRAEPSRTSVAAAAAPVTAPAAMSDAKPQPVREEIVGNLYTNHTYGFDIYKPPDWEMLPEERHSLPNAVAAMGTDDDTTLLLIGREPRKGALDAQAAATDSELHNIYDNFRVISATNTDVAGEPAIERHFRGTAADRDWSVTVVSVAHGDNLFTVLGMTYADSDLIQIQENVIARAISSLRFETP